MLIYTNGSESPLSYDVTGIGLDRKAFRQRSRDLFGDQLLGTTPTKTVPISNSGEASLPLTEFAISGGTNQSFTFLQASCSFKLLNAGQSCSISIQFAPKTVGQAINKCFVKLLTHETQAHPTADPMQLIGPDVVRSELVSRSLKVLRKIGDDLDTAHYGSL